jgi:hypothetical protein
MDEVVADLQATANEIAQLTFDAPALQQVQTLAIQSDFEAFRDEVADDSLQLQKMVDNLTAKLDAIANRPNVSADQQWNLKSYLIGVLGVAVPAGAAIIYEIITRFASNQSADDVPGVSEDDKARLQTLVQSLQQVDDHTYWGSLLVYVNNNNPTNADLIYFMQYTEQIFPLTQPFYWSTTSDKLAVIQKLSQALQQGGTTALIQQLQDGLDDGHGVALPREIAANCASLALGGSS